MHKSGYANSVAALSGLGPLRVWSLLVTVFGDLAQDCALDGPTLSTIMAQIGIKPEATRVALHRLRGDGWITSEKAGRTSLYRLTAQGQRDSAAARPRIYGRPEQMAQSAELIVTPQSGAALNPVDFAQIAPRLYICGVNICGTGATIPPDAMRLHPTDLPPWLSDEIETPAMRASYAALHVVLTDIQTALPADANLIPLHISVLRILIVHGWRRLTLKHPDLPRAAHSRDWRGHDCRALVTAWLDRLERPAIDQIKAA
jgi:phenylacetic acid degradation operon negative regulatory protein